MCSSWNIQRSEDKDVSQCHGEISLHPACCCVGSLCVPEIQAAAYICVYIVVKHNIPDKESQYCDKYLFAFAKAKSRWKCDAHWVFQQNSIASPWIIFKWWGDVESFPDCSSNQVWLGVEADKQKHWILKRVLVVLISQNCQTWERLISLLVSALSIWQLKVEGSTPDQELTLQQWLGLHTRWDTPSAQVLLSWCSCWNLA